MIPGGDLLDDALSVIDARTALYYKSNNRTLNSVGQFVTTYDAPVEVLGSMQPVPRYRYEAYGLDFSKSYYTFYTSTDIIAVNRNVSGDQIIFASQLYQCQSSNDWFTVDGWKGILCVLLGDAS